MYGLTSKQIKTKAVIALVIGIAMAVYAIIFQESDVSGTAQIALYFLSR